MLSARYSAGECRRRSWKSFAATEAVNRRDREGWLALADPEAEFRADPNWPESEIVRGREAIWDITISIADTWEQDPPVEIAEVIDAGDDRLVVRDSSIAAK